jgi:hypothetical protein
MYLSQRLRECQNNLANIHGALETFEVATTIRSEAVDWKRVKELVDGAFLNADIADDAYHEAIESLDTQQTLVRVRHLVSAEADWKKRIDGLEAKEEEVLGHLNGKVEELITLYAQRVPNKEIESLEGFYEGQIELHSKESDRTSSFYRWTLGAVFAAVAIVGALQFFVTADKLVEHWPAILASITIVGFLTFIATDLRKRRNIFKTILDELEQKKVMAKSYAVLFGETLRKEGLEEFAAKLQDSLVSQLLIVRNHGFSGKDMMNHSPYPIYDLLAKGMDRSKSKEKSE